MVSDQELDEATAQLAEFRTNNDGHQKTQNELLEKYSLLVQDYKRLRSDLEEERDSRERYKQLAKGQERNPFVLVLIDGDGYVFEDGLISNGVEGGQRAVHLLNEVVKNSLRGRGLEHCRIMVRVYANISGLSKALSKVKLAGPEKRSLAPFVASFNRTNDLFDFVDAGELKENADFKIRALFRQFVENAQCRHIYFAACHDSGYISDLTQYMGSRDRITLVKTPAFHREFTKLNLRIEDFPNIFRTMPLDMNVPSTPMKSASPAATMAVAAAPTADSQQICAFYLKGQCKYGNSCRFPHVKAKANGHQPTGSMADIKDWRARSSSDNNSVPFGLNSLNKNDNDFMSGHGLGHSNSTPNGGDFVATLPGANEIPPGQIPLNENAYRLDALLPVSSPEEKAAFNSRTASKKLCNNYHINGQCQNGDACSYDHRPAPPGVLNCLNHVILNNPCPRRGACRNLNCLYGHICQKQDCKYRGGNVYCKFPPQVHYQPMSLDIFVAGTSKDGSNNYNSNTKNHVEEFEAQSVSGKGSSTPPLMEVSSPKSVSDEETTEVEGALIDPADDASVD